MQSLIDSRFSPGYPQWLCGNSYTWGHDVWLHIAGETESAQQAKQGG